MKFTISSSKLFSQLQAVSRVINNKNSLPILDDVLFDLVGNELKLTASDGETTIRTSVEVEGVEGGGKVASAAKLLLETLKEFSEQPLAFTIDENNFAVSMVSQNGTYSFVGVNGNEYPEMPGAEMGARELAIPANVLQSAIEKTIFATADDDLRPVMNGIFFDIAEDKVTMVATDAHRLVRYSNTGVKPGVAASFILPKKPASLLKNLLAKEENEVKVTFGAKNARFEFGSTIIVCRQIEGRFPNYNAVIPQSNQNIVTVDRQTIINACKRVAVFANNGTAQLRLALTENSIKISAQDIDFSTSAEETITCDYNGTPMAIGFKAPFLIDLLSSITSADVLLKLADPARAGLLLPAENEENEDVLMLLMPMLLND
ncbi:MAG: DNA polymerase III subunit beta [Paludibacteraceae bacterium]|jgi:DNA polymerase-3 subunit beta|nr:DNA polymerase III subunit beta [Paludibacteraceae bacterium]MBR1380865.1 DNA polymerase III subunit beta [Paludibacteraceae bacterium]MDY6380206.1 DNA polymerase III subunit beta [Bacteroidales bacterium]MDY6406798.1 DNA polymerase III subunit beta [Bacteroidales bacterium]